MTPGSRAAFPGDGRAPSIQLARGRLKRAVFLEPSEGQQELRTSVRSAVVVSRAAAGDVIAPAGVAGLEEVASLVPIEDVVAVAAREAIVAIAGPQEHVELPR